MNTFSFCNLEDEINKMNIERQGNSADRHTKTLAKTDSYRLLLVQLHAGAHIKEHQVEGRIFIQTLHGEITIQNKDQTISLPQGGLATFGPNEKHDVSALQDSTFLVTITVLDN